MCDAGPSSQASIEFANSQSFSELPYAWELTHSNAPIDSPIGAETDECIVFSQLSIRAAAWEAGLFLLISHISIGIHRGTHATLRDQAALEKNGAFTQKVRLLMGASVAF